MNMEYRARVVYLTRYKIANKGEKTEVFHNISFITCVTFTLCYGCRFGVGKETLTSISEQTE
ncbi:Troponin C, isoform 2 [Armadillidium vulgare]|nr:Troponin C, isoform 2 [Armadillidium vulgare]